MAVADEADARRARRAIAAGPAGALAAILAAPSGQARAGTTRHLLLAPPPDGPAWAPLWAALLREGRSLPGPQADIRALWSRLVACATGDTEALAAVLGDPTLPYGPRRGTDRAALAGAIRAGLAPARRARLLAARQGCVALPGTASLPMDTLAELLAEGLPARALRRAALRSAALGPPGDDPARRQGISWEALVPRDGPFPRPMPPPGPPMAGGITRASRLRCARWLTRLPRPAWRAALALAAGGEADALPTWRALAAGMGDGPGREEAAWELAAHGGEGDIPAIRAALGPPGRPGEAPEHLRRAVGILGARPDSPAARAAGEATLDRARDWGLGRLATLLKLGDALPDAGARAAAELLLWKPATEDAARWLVRRAPHLATTEALAASGLLPWLSRREGALATAGGGILRRRRDGVLARDRRATGGWDPEGDRLRALQGADRALRHAWALALGTEEDPGEG